MGFAQILAGLHFHKPAGGALRLRLADANLQQLRQMRLGGKNQLDAAIVKFVYQPGKAPPAIRLPCSETSYFGDEDRVETAGEFDVISLAARTAAQLVEAEPRHARAGAQRPYRATFYFQLDIALALAPGDGLEGLGHGH